jgi:hypothetical protein
MKKKEGTLSNRKLLCGGKKFENFITNYSLIAK